MSIDSFATAKNELLNEVAQRRYITGQGGLREDFARVIAIATQLFTAIEIQARHIEERIVIACGEQVRPPAEVKFREPLNRVTASLEATHHELEINLGRRIEIQPTTPLRRATDS